MPQVVKYTPSHFDALQATSGRTGHALGLRHRPFVDYYYATRAWCRLYLFMTDDDRIEGTLGVDLMRFETDGRALTVGFGSNFTAARPGVGGYLFIKWMRSCAVGIAFGGSADFHEVIRRQRWRYFDGPNVYFLNSPSPSRPGDAWWVALAKWGLTRCFRQRFSRRASRIPPGMLSELSVQEEHEYTESLLPRRSPFGFRFAPPLEYLSWRYDLTLSFVRYRLFRVLEGGKSVGYVIINESPRGLIVAHCDGEDPSTLAYGVLLSLLEVAREDEKPRGVVLAASHPVMLRIYRRFGFHLKWPSRPFALGGFRGSVQLPDADTSGWLINYDWGDNGLRAPFRDQTDAGAVRASA